MKIMKITKIEILINAVGTDKVFIHTNLPPTFPEIVDMRNMQMSIDLQHGTAINYIKKHFGNNPEFPSTAILIDGKRGTKEVIIINN